MISALPISDGDLAVRAWSHEDVETLARWPSFPPADAAFNLPYLTLAAADRKRRFDSKEADSTRVTLVADLPADPVVAYLALVEIDWAAGSVGNMAVRVKPEWCGKGLGTRLLRLVTQWCFDQGMSRLRLDVAAPNARAIRCYEKSGFARTGEFWREGAGLPDVDLNAAENTSPHPHVNLDGTVQQIRFCCMEKVRPYCTLRHADLSIEYVSVEEAFVQDTCEALREALAQLRGFFGLKEMFPPVRVILTPDRPEFDRCVRDILKVKIEVPSSPWRVAQPQRTDLVILSPCVWEKEYNSYSPEGYRRLIAHETTHIVEEHISPDIEGVRRWWSEGLAMYLSEQWRDVHDLETVCRCVAAGRIPALSDIDVAADEGGKIPREAVKRAYEWGWTLVMFMSARYGCDTIRKIVSSCADGDVFGTAGIDKPRFEREWKAWLATEAQTRFQFAAVKR